MSAAESSDLRRWLSAGAQAIHRARDRLDEINVFPVPDSDTGTNMYLTLQEGNRAVAKLPPTATHREVVAAFARGALMGARGNSGVIVSQWLGGFLTAIDAGGGLSDAPPTVIAGALRSAADAAFGAVGEPVGGTILTVARAAATSAEQAAQATAGRNDVIVAAVIGARTALRATTDQLPQAKDAGVVDAGAAGLVLQLEMLAETLAGRGALDGLDKVEWELASTGSGVVAVPVSHDHRGTGGAYEVMFVASVPDRASSREITDQLTSSLVELGDSVAVGASHGKVQAHVHTDHPDAAVRLGVERGANQIVVSSLVLAHGGANHQGGIGVVALTSCPGLAAPVADAGAIVLVVADPTTVTRKALRRAIEDASSEGVVVVAGNPYLRAAALELAGRKGAPRMEVLDASHEAHVIAAVAAAALATPGEPLAEVMQAAVERCEAVSTSVDAVGDDVARVLTADAEMISVVLARGVPASAGDAVRRLAADVCPSADVVVYQGEHGHPGVLVGVERGA